MTAAAVDAGMSIRCPCTRVSGGADACKRGRLDDEPAAEEFPCGVAREEFPGRVAREPPETA